MKQKMRCPICGKIYAVKTYEPIQSEPIKAICTPCGIEALNASWERYKKHMALKAGDPISTST